MKNKKFLLVLLLVLFMPLMVDALDDYVSLDWKSEIGNDLYQDITKIGDDIYVLSKKAIYKFDSSGKKTEIPLELCDMGSFSGNRVVCYNYSDSSFRTPHPYDDRYNKQKEYLYEYDLTGKIVNKVLAWEGSVGTDRVGRGFDFERVSKADNLYFFFNGPRMLGAYDTDGNKYYGAYRWNDDTEDFGYYDDNYDWVTVDISKYFNKLDTMSDVGYIYDYFYRRELDKYKEKYKDQLNQMGLNYTYEQLVLWDELDLPTQAMIASSYKDKYYVGYLDPENSTYMALVHDKTTGKDIDIKINGKLFFSVILGDDYFILLDSDTSTCNQKECKKTHMKKYNYEGTVIEEEDIMIEDNSFMGTSVGYVTDGGFTVIAGNRPDGEIAYTTSLIRFNKPTKKVDKKVTGEGNVVIDKSKANVGDRITFEVNPGKNYEVDSIKVIDSNGNVIETTGNSFIMPDTDVTVEVVFKELVNPKTGYFDYIFGSVLIISAASILFLYSNKRQKTIE